MIREYARSRQCRQSWAATAWPSRVSVAMNVTWAHSLRIWRQGRLRSAALTVGSRRAAAWSVQVLQHVVGGKKFRAGPGAVISDPVAQGLHGTAAAHVLPSRRA
ncbi:hypothetical protein ADL04_38750 [Streptomyces sp. NRRL B-3648]|nr:hypothetical protein ADL04_38750 [Streptomyces sp. NRRL B-3648]